MGICVVLEMAKKDPENHIYEVLGSKKPENHIYEVLVLPDLLCLQLHLPGKSLFLGLWASPPEVSKYYVSWGNL